jgi:hypothetical protein
MKAAAPDRRFAPSGVTDKEDKEKGRRFRTGLSRLSSTPN